MKLGNRVKGRPGSWEIKERMEVTQHIESIGTEFFGNESFAECSCGFKGPIRENELLAAQDLIDHRKNWRPE